MATRPDNEKTHRNSTPTAEPAEPARELSEDELKKVAGGTAKAAKSKLSDIPVTKHTDTASPP